MPYDYDTRYPTLTGMSWAERDVKENGYENHAQLLTEVREQMAQQDAQTSKWAAEREAWATANPEVVAEWEKEDHWSWGGPTQAQEDAYNERFGGWGDEPTVDHVCIGGQSYYQGQDYGLNDHVDHAGHAGHADTDGS